MLTQHRPESVAASSLGFRVVWVAGEAFRSQPGKGERRRRRRRRRKRKIHYSRLTATEEEEELEEGEEDQKAQYQRIIITTN
jgi:hypothetical protein